MQKMVGTVELAMAFGSEFALLPDFTPLERMFVRLYGSMSPDTVQRFLILKHFALEHFEKKGVSREKILDFGCAFGCFGFMLARQCSRATVCLHDVDPEAESRCRWIIERGRFDNVRYLNAEQFKDENDFSLTLAIDVLEHIENDRKALEEIYKRTRRGGHLYVAVPCFSGEQLSDEDLYDGHVRTGYRLEGIQSLLAQTGFKVIVKSQGCSTNPGLVLSLLDNIYRGLTSKGSHRFNFGTAQDLSFWKKVALAFIWPFYRVTAELDVAARGVQNKSIVLLAQKFT